MGVLRRLSPSFRRKSVSSRSKVSAIDAEVDFVMQRSPYLLSAEQEAATPARTSSSSGNSSIVAVFQRKEFQIGTLLGEGSFSKVHAIIGFRLTANHYTCKGTRFSKEQPQENQNRIALSQSAFDGKGTSRYAVKCLKKDLTKSSQDFRNAATDLVVEAKYLAALDHPNIVKLRGTARDGTMSYCDGHDGFFLIMDRMHETLDQRIQKWKLHNSLPLHTKVDYALQIAGALAYLHERRILYRDLKPANVAFQENSPHTIQLFDFGLCRELPESGSCDKNDEDGMFHMSGAGTRMYMAVEIFNKKYYNLKADVYSWAFCLYEMIALTRPFDHYTFEEHKEFVAEIGMRPELKTEYNLPSSLEDVIRGAWEQDPAQRLTICQVHNNLRPIVSQLNDELQQRHQEDSRPSSSKGDARPVAGGSISRSSLESTAMLSSGNSACSAGLDDSSMLMGEQHNLRVTV